MEPPNVRDALVGDEQYAPDAASVWAAVTAATTRRRLTRRRFVIGGVVAGVAAIATGTTLSRTLSNHTAIPGPSPTTTSRTTLPSDRSATTAGSPTSVLKSASPAASAANLAHGRWTSLPSAPIAPRGSPAAVWTGTEMLVWGGLDNNTFMTDGAAYDPATRRWRTLAPAPAGSHARWDGTWIGTSLILWGVAAEGKDTQPTGARYDPSTDHWQMLPDAPIGISSTSQTVWTGSVMVALAIPTGTDPGRLEAASYDPGTDMWSPLPPVDLPAGHPAVNIQLAAAGSTVYLWCRWQHSTRTTSRGGIEVDSTAGTDCFKLDGTTWRPVSFTGGSGMNGSGPIWTGTVFLQPAAENWAGDAFEPMPQGLTGRLLDPATGRITDITHGPVDDLGPSSIWTGSALICFDTGTYTSGAGRADYPGEAAVWDPSTNSWTPLPAPGLASNEGPAAVWTGSSLLMWGSFYPSKTANSATAPHVAAAGLEFTVTPSPTPTPRSPASTSR